MKLIHFGDQGQEMPGLIDAEGIARDLTGPMPDIAGAVLSDEGLGRISALDPSGLPAVPKGARIGPCDGGTGKLVCVGLNYSDHAAETGREVPSEPIVFMKATSAICGPDDPIIIPRGSDKADWEVEMNVIIGTRAKYVSEADVLSHVAGYAVTNDVSEREFQMEWSGQWTNGKSCDNFGQTGPWLVIRDEVPDPQDLGMWLTLNGKTMQDGSTRTMVFGVAHLVSYLSQFKTLHPGDLISTGTPPGVGPGQKPPLYLKPGDVVELGIEELDSQRQDVIAHPEEGAK